VDNQIGFVSAVSTELDVDEALRALVAQIDSQPGAPGFDYVTVFVSRHFALQARHISKTLRKALKPQVLIGCSAEGIIGYDHELESRPAIALMAARLPGVELKAFALQPEGMETILDDADLFLQAVGAPAHPKLFILLVDPFSTNMDRTLTLFNSFHAEVPVVGGMASGAQAPGQNALFVNNQVLNGGAVGVGLAGKIEVDVVVSQGCRAIGPTFTVTSAQQNMIHSLDGSPALAQIQRFIANLGYEERVLVQNGLLVGRAIESEADALGRGRFLIRGIVGANQRTGSVAIGDRVRPGETIQFHVRDATTAREDLEMMLSPQTLFGPASGALLFSCNGRGTHLYQEPDGDLTTIRQFLGPIPLAGFFCAGEIGPIAGENFVHGHTASLVLFRPAAEE
jgi:small ligand-binding sensory domain FIST